MVSQVKAASSSSALSVTSSTPSSTAAVGTTVPSAVSTPLAPHRSPATNGGAARAPRMAGELVSASRQIVVTAADSTKVSSSGRWRTRCSTGSRVTHRVASTAEAQQSAAVAVPQQGAADGQQHEGAGGGVDAQGLAVG